MKFPLLSAIVLLPAVGGCLLLVAGARLDSAAKKVALCFSGASGALALGAAVLFRASGPAWQLQEEYTWIKDPAITYHVGLDGAGLMMVLLTVFLVTMCLWISPAETSRPRIYFALMLAMEAGLLGVFVSLDLVLFYIAWEIAFLPIFFVISMYGDEGSEKAAIRFLVYMLVGSFVMLLGIVLLYLRATPQTFDMVALQSATIPPAVQRMVFAAFFIGLAVKVPLFPFHVWLPDAYTLAPTPVTMVMSGSLAAMGAFAFWRVCLALLPEGTLAFANLVAVLAVITVIYGDLCATVQRDIKRMTAYSSMSHMGFIMFGAISLNSIGVKGSMLHTFNHGLFTAGFFLVIFYLQQLAGSRNANELSFLTVRTPILAGALWFSSLASFGMPGLSGFPGELYVLLGGYKRFPVLAVIALVGALIMAGYIFWVLARTTLNRPADGVSVPKIDDMDVPRMAVYLPLAVPVLVLGLAPILVTRVLEMDVVRLLARYVH